MKRLMVLILLFVSVASLTGCIKGVESCPVANTTPGEENNQKEKSSTNMISSAQLSPAVFAALEAEWSAWSAKDEMQKVVSSHLPGHIYKQFDAWAECEEFVGFKIFNPLEDSGFEKGSYVGMPVGANDVSRFYISLYGTNEGQVQWIHVQSGYRDGEIRINVNAQISPDVIKESLDAQEPLITEDSGERYVATEALLTQGPVTYSIRVIGGKGEWDGVRETLEEVLPYFGKSFLGAPTKTPTPSPEPEPIKTPTPSPAPEPTEEPDMTPIPTESPIPTETPVPTEAVVEKKSLLDFLRIAMEPVGHAMYVWSGGWNEEDTGAGEEAVTLGVSPVWAEFAAKQDDTYNYKETKYQIHNGLDCSGYIGWAVYNVLETENGKEGYVSSATKIAEEFAARGLGEYIPVRKISHWQAGDIMSMEGHTWIVVGMCEDGSVLLLHCSPPGVSFCGIKLADGSKSLAVSLAERIMQTYYPEWYARYPRCSRSISYLTKSSAMRWSREILKDEEGLAGMSAEEIISILFNER